MVVKVYVSGISGNKEVKKRQQRVTMILDSRNIKYEVVDIAEPDNEEDKDFMQANSTSLGATIGDSSPRHPLPPQIFNDKEYCGDYDKFDMSNEIDELERFLKLTSDDTMVTSSAELNLSNPKSGSVADSTAASENNEAEAKNGTVDSGVTTAVAADADDAEPSSASGDAPQNGDVTESNAEKPDGNNEDED